MSKWLPVPRNTEEVETAAQRLKASDDWLIVTHERPDGDALGSAFAMAHIMQALGKQWTFIAADPLPIRFSYLPLFEKAVIASDNVTRTFSHVVSLDCADMERFEALHKYLDKDVEIINIDHHRTNPQYGAAAIVDAEASATCELVYHVARELEITLSKELATCLYTGLLTDTGGFALPNTTRVVHQIAAILLASGVLPYDVAEPALESRSWEQMRLLKLALMNLTVSEDGRYAAVYATQAMLKESGATQDDADLLVGFARGIDTVEVGLLFKELPDGTIKASLRSKRYVDVSRIAQHFGGGGHVRAAGCTLGHDLEEAMNAIIEKVKEALDT
ncbi:bifunctional oligoribonuclease/PAP phosphatase NrnA [Alicyclobacillus sp. SO9]|uniref:DHH family phosphoesterase n=1 Tax=Alicyclobacillus sp. SO9 TaxID=2665646 RepID=UPI0018E74B2D|nr:bifunctional oligoribonuclease/PAP phosphatase NrnA [Alicyclobacillus sp. SO9]QQE80846.1 bifunctional oligoribonuclease/PAP phosphatase NrnA [Alicyclobacillus sp. SO9]